MTKKRAVRKKSAKRDKRPNKGWGQVYVFIKAPKLEPPQDGVFGAVYYALRSLKKGNVAEVTEEAMKKGLHKFTKQNPRVQVQIKLRRLVRIGSAKKEKEKSKNMATPTKPTPKKSTPPKKKVVVKKAVVTPVVEPAPANP